MSDSSLVQQYLAVMRQIPFEASSKFVEALEGGSLPARAAADAKFDFTDLAPLDSLMSRGVGSVEMGRDLRSLYDAVSQCAPAQLVWTGPSVAAAGFVRSTFPVARSLVSDAKKELLIAGYVTQVEILERLGIRGTLQRGVAVTVLTDGVDLSDPGVRSLVACGVTMIDASPDRQGLAKFHPKAIVSDSRRALVGSANLTNLGQSRNVELGLLVEGEIATRIAALFHRYVAAVGSSEKLISRVSHA